MNKNTIHPGIFFTISLLGLWLLVTPATFGFHSQLVTYNSYLCGIALIILGEACRRKPRHYWIWVIVLIGIWLQFAPLIFWAPEAASYLNDTFVGAWLITLAITIHPLPGEDNSDKSAIPPGWSYNPSSWTQRIPIAFLAFICWTLARYLAAYQLGYIDTVWDPFFSPGTKNVLESNVSKAFPVSDAGLGALAYTIEFFSACQGGQNRWRTAPWLVLIFGILVIPVSLVSVILIILQPLVVGTWCTLCLCIAVCMLIAIPLAIGEVAATIQYLRLASKHRSFLTLLFKGGSCPKEKIDRQTPSMDCSFLIILKSALSGITFPWNLALCAIFGIALMAVPSLLGISEGLLFDLDPILGAFTAVVSVISFAEYARKARWINLLFASVLLIAAIFSHESALLHIAFACAIALLSIRKGPILERCNTIDQK